MKNPQAIGVFDSGLGGLSIAHAIEKILPEEDLVYFADLEYSPYGPKSKEIIAERSERIVDFLKEQNCKLIVVACNTATVNSIEILRSKFSIPIVGVEPGIKPAVMKSESAVIGVLATEQTLKSGSFKRLKSSYSKNSLIEVMPCPDFVTLVETLQHKGDSAKEAVERYIRPLLEKKCDQIVLGCTHFSFLKDRIKDVVGDQAEIIDTAEAVAKQVFNKLSQLDIQNNSDSKNTIKFWTSRIENSSKAVSHLWGKEVSVFHAKL